MDRMGRIFRGLLIVVLAAAALAWAAPEARAQGDTNEVELIESTQSDTIMVNGLAVSLTDAEVSATLDVGTAVWIEGVALEDGTILAREVVPAEDGVLLPGELEIVGTLDSLVSDAAVVNGLAFDLAVAEVQTGLAAGDLVKVHAGLSTNGDWIAREIERFVPGAADGSGTDDSSADDSADDNGTDDNSTDDNSTGNSTGNLLPRFEDGEFEIVGTLTDVSEGLIVVAGQQVDITGAEMHGTPLLGALVKVHLSLVNGQWVAREVEAQFDSHRGQHSGDDDLSGDDHSGSSGSNSSDDPPGDDHDGSGSSSDDSADSGSSSDSAMDDNDSSDQGSDDASGDDQGDDGGSDSNHVSDDSSGDDGGDN